MRAFKRMNHFCPNRYGMVKSYSFGNYNEMGSTGNDVILVDFFSVVFVWEWINFAQTEAYSGPVSPSYVNVIVVMAQSHWECVHEHNCWEFVANNLCIHVKSSKLVYCLIFVELAIQWRMFALFLFIPNHNFHVLVFKVNKENKSPPTECFSSSYCCRCRLSAVWRRLSTSPHHFFEMICIVSSLIDKCPSFAYFYFFPVASHNLLIV